MDSSQRIKTKQILLLASGLSLFIGLLFFGMWLTDPEKGKMNDQEIKKLKESELIKNYKVSSQSIVKPQDSWMAISEKEILNVKNENNELKTKLEDLYKKIDEVKNQKDLAKSFNLSDPLPMTKSEIIIPPNPVKDSQLIDSNFSQGSLREPIQDETEEQGIEVIDLSVPEVTEKKKVKNISHYIPSGSFTKAILLSGMDAPTGGQAQQNPMPVLMKIMDNGQLPNFFKGHVKDCHVTGAAFGEISSERALIRLETLSCVLEEGKVIEAPIKGYVTGEDGKNGLRGRLVSKQGALIAKSAMAGIFSGMGQAISQQFQQIQNTALGSVQTMDPKKVGESGLAKGTSNAMEKIADFYMARANETYPIIEIDAQRMGEIILTAGAELEVENENENENENSKEKEEGKL
jgi:conjugal transfer pilus assembly protein TraB